MVGPHKVRLCFFTERNLADGKCIIEPVLKDDVVLERASYRDLSHAARGLFFDCVMRNQVGGIATDIGMTFYFVHCFLLYKRLLAEVNTDLWRKGRPED